MTPIQTPPMLVTTMFDRALEKLNEGKPEQQKLKFDDVVFTVTECTGTKQRTFTVLAEQKSWFYKILTSISDFFAESIYKITSLFGSTAPSPQEERKEAITNLFLKKEAMIPPLFSVEGRDVALYNQISPQDAKIKELASVILPETQAITERSVAIDPQVVDSCWGGFMHYSQDLLVAFGDQHKIERLQNLRNHTPATTSEMYPDLPKYTKPLDNAKITFKDFFESFVSFRTHVTTTNEALDSTQKSQLALALTQKFHSTFQFLCTYETAALKGEAEAIFLKVQKDWETFTPKDRACFINLLKAVTAQIDNEQLDKKDLALATIKEKIKNFIAANSTENTTTDAPIPMSTWDKMCSVAGRFFTAQNLLEKVAPVVVTAYFFGPALAAAMAAGFATKAYTPSIAERVASYFPTKAQPLVDATIQEVLPYLAAGTFYRAVDWAFSDRTYTHIMHPIGVAAKVEAVACQIPQDLPSLSTSEPAAILLELQQPVMNPTITAEDANKVIQDFDNYCSGLIDGLKRYATELNIDLSRAVES